MLNSKYDEMLAGFRPEDFYTEETTRTYFDSMHAFLCGKDSYRVEDIPTDVLRTTRKRNLLREMLFYYGVQYIITCFHEDKAHPHVKKLLGIQ